MIWHPAKWWIQKIPGLINPVKQTIHYPDPEDDDVFQWPDDGSGQTLSDPPGLLDSGNYMWLGDGPDAVLISEYYQCLTCCCVPAKCNLPNEILMTISGFSGTLSSVDRPAAFGYGPGNVCPECNSILWSSDTVSGLPGHRWSGYNEDCCKCRQGEQFYWWPRNIEGNRADGNSICTQRRAICKTFPNLCYAPEESVTHGGRIAARYVNPCPWPCTDFEWSDYDPAEPGRDPAVPFYSLVELTDCAQAPLADARQDWNCINKPKVEYVREADSYLWPPGFRGPGAVNLLPLCNNRFWNDTTYYRFCVSGGFWCQMPDFENHCYCSSGWWGSDEDFFYPLRHDDVIQDIDRNSQHTWCLESPTRCKGPVPVARVGWSYMRPRIVLVSQPTRSNCALCPGYGFGYGSDFSNYGRGQDWYDPYDDGHCIGKTDVDTTDFNQTFMMYAQPTDNPPCLKPTVSRTRIKPESEAKLIDAQLLYQIKKYWQNDPPCSCFGHEQGYWNLDYPCEPKEYEPNFCFCFICTTQSGIVTPKLQPFYVSGNGANAKINFVLRNYCPPGSLAGYGPSFNGFFWYFESISVDENQRGADYKVGERFYFSYYESPLRGGEMIWPEHGGRVFQDAQITEVGPDGEILKIELIRHPKFGLCAFSDSIPPQPYAPLYGRLLNHAYAVGNPGNGYQEGDVFVFEPTGGPPESNIPTGNKYYPYFSTSMRYKTKARATVLEVDSRGGVVDWYMCGAKNVYQLMWVDDDRNPARVKPTLVRVDERNCNGADDTGIYYADYKYTNRCEYNYVGHVPVKYSWSGWFDYHFHRGSYCEHAWAEFNFKIDQVSVKNTISVAPPPTIPGIQGRQAKLRISSVGPMTVQGHTIDPLRYQNYERSPGPAANTTYYSDGQAGYAAWFKNHTIPVDQGTVVTIEVVDPGAGYVKKVIDSVDPNTGVEQYHWEAIDVSTEIDMEAGPFIGVRGIQVRGVADDIRMYAKTKWGWPALCKCKGNITKLAKINEKDLDFGGISSVQVLQGGLWYFKHDHDDIWFAKAGSNWYFEFADPLSESNPTPRDIDKDTIFDQEWAAPCFHASRDNWGEMHHYDGFKEAPEAGYHSRTQLITVSVPSDDGSPPTDREVLYTSYFCAEKGTAPNYEWPESQRRIGDPPPGSNNLKRWSTDFCPNELFERQFRMILVHPCAACAKELGLAGGQTCWNMNGFGDTTYAFYPDQWGGTGTALITGMGGSSLTFTTSLPKEAK